MIDTIVLVDDNSIQAATRRAILDRLGNPVVVCSSAKDALRFLESDAARRVGLIITDHLMPGMNGPQFVAMLRQSLPALPVVVLSGLPDAELDYTGLNIIFRLKPFPPDQLIALAQSLLRNPLSRTA